MNELHEQALAVANRHIIERPRLTRLLDETTARVILLVAPAGYGKTTLARQWLRRCRQAWVHVTPAHGDVAALAAAVARSLRPILGQESLAVMKRLASSRSPSDDIEALVALQAADLANWPEGTWMVLDEYESLCDARASEEYVQLLLGASKINLLVTSRRKPSWATARGQIYGDFRLIDQQRLKMDDDEARRVLAQVDLAPTDALISAAAGWPAVLGLAAAGAVDNLSTKLPNTLYEYVAEELYDKSSEELRQALPKLALASRVTAEAAAIVCGRSAPRVLEEIYGAGYVTDDVDAPSFHPLLKEFLLRKLAAGTPDALTVAAGLIDLYIAQTDWDSAFHVFRNHPASEPLLRLIASGSDALLREGRTVTLSEWLQAASKLGAQTPLLDVLRAEVAMREGRVGQAEQLAIYGSRHAGPELRFRALCVAGLAAHLDNREVTALQYFTEAEELASNPGERQIALWGALSCAIMFDDPASLRRALDAFLEHKPSSADDVVRSSNARLCVAAVIGELSEAVESAMAVLDLTTECDPLVATSFLNGLSRMLSLLTRYDEGLAVVDRALQLAEDTKLALVRPHLLVTKAVALVGLETYGEAADVLSAAEEIAREIRDEHNLADVRGVRARLSVASGAFDDAIAITEEAPARVTDGMQAEYRATHALALACAGRIDEAQVAIETLPRVAPFAEAASLVSATRAVRAARLRDDHALTAELESLDHLGTLDALVIAMRGSSELRRAISRVASPTTPALQDVLRVFATRHSSLRGPLSSLTPRETEVLRLLAKGCTNREIAESLVIAEVTAKAHVRNILRKLGVRSRTEAAVLTMTLVRGAAAMPVDQPAPDS